MTKHRHTYRFNPHSLRYERVKVPLHERLRHISFSALSGVLLGMAIVVVVLHFVESPKERMLKRELAQYRLLGDRVERAERVLENLEERDEVLYRTIFDSEPVSQSERFGGLRDDAYYAEMALSQNSRLLASTTKKVDDLTRRLYVQSRSLDEIYEMALTKNERLAAMPAIMPISKEECQVVSGFGNRYHPILQSQRMHSGIDFAARQGTGIYATGDGVVRVAGQNPEGYSGYGVVVLIDHGFGFKTLYAHMKKATVRVGQRVKRGEQIGIVGTSGMSSGSHLHYEVHSGDKKVDPVYYFFNDLTPEEYEEVLEKARQENQCMS
ncbi:MAG: peptidoglycan DD-metalloendopeptidase family protein [Bacteroidales bacterium]|nr:peptidoglycan DD-metalloendopeptidase family protein [Bacteroidales bacterium]